MKIHQQIRSNPRTDYEYRGVFKKASSLNYCFFLEGGGGFQFFTNNVENDNNSSELRQIDREFCKNLPWFQMSTREYSDIHLFIDERTFIYS